MINTFIPIKYLQIYVSVRFSFCQKHSDTNLYSEKHQAQGEAIAQSGSIYADVSQARLKHFPFKTWPASPSGKVHTSSQKHRVHRKIYFLLHTKIAFITLQMHVLLFAAQQLQFLRCLIAWWGHKGQSENGCWWVTLVPLYSHSACLWLVC